MVHRSDIHYSKIHVQGNWKKYIQFHLEWQKVGPPRHLAKLSGWKGRLELLGIDTQLNSLKLNGFNGFKDY